MSFENHTRPISASAAGTFKLGGDLEINRMGFGAMQLPGPGVWGPPKDREKAIAVVRKAVELGVNHIDTSDFYGPHVANQILREALYPYPEDLVLVTKVGARRTPDKAWPAALSPSELRDAVYDNLRNLGVERLDVVNLRIVEESGGLSPVDSIAEPFGVLAELREQGLIRHLGLSNVSVAQFEEAQTIAPIVCVQNEYNMLRQADEELVNRCTAEGIGYVSFFPLGTYTLQHDEKFDEDAKVPKSVPLSSSVVDAVAERHGVTPYQVALAWLLARSSSMLCIPGTSSIEHLEQNIASASFHLDEEDLRKLGSVGEDTVNMAC